MSKVKLLLDVVNDIRHLADSLECVANSIVENTPESPCQEGDSSAKSTRLLRLQSIKYAPHWQKRAVTARPLKSKHFCTSTTQASSLA